jgi:hypothetical protein
MPVTAVMIAESESPGACAICIGAGAGACIGAGVGSAVDVRGGCEPAIVDQVGGGEACTGRSGSAEEI